MPIAFRASPPNQEVQDALGLLAGLPGHWVGHGFNLIARPERTGNPPFLLELNSTKETLDFTSIGGDIPNRGSVQGDIELKGLHYLQQVSDHSTDTGLHVEPGLWIHVPPTLDPAVADDTYVRQSTIPHGDSLLAQSTFTTTVSSGPTIAAVDSTPFTGPAPALNGPPGIPITDQAYLEQYQTTPLPGGLPAGMDQAATVKNPALVLNKEIEGLEITNTVVIEISTTPVGGILNIPFVAVNANAVQLDAIFWVERVRHPIFGEFLQLQYLQRVILDFVGIQWPHISVATLRKQ